MSHKTVKLNKLQRNHSACPKTAKMRKKAQKGVKRRKKATSWRKKAHAWRQKASIGAFWRLFTHFGELGKNIVFCNYFLIFFIIFIKSMKKVCFFSLFHSFCWIFNDLVVYILDRPPLLAITPRIIEHNKRFVT